MSGHSHDHAATTSWVPLLIALAAVVVIVAVYYRNRD